jgi:hypothetical protein
LAELAALEQIHALRRQALDAQLSDVDSRLGAAEDAARDKPTLENAQALNALLAERNAILDQIDSGQIAAASERRALVAAQEREQIQQLVEQYRQWLSVANQVVGNSLGDFFDDLLTGTKSAKEAFADFARSVLRDFTRLVSQMVAQRVILGTLGLLFPGAAVGAAAAGAFNEGGEVPGPAGPDRDSVMAALTPGEFVVRRGAVRKLGLAAL